MFAGRFALVVVGVALTVSVSAQPLSPAVERHMAAGDERETLAAAGRSVFWTGDTAPIFVSVAREIYDPSINDDESWVFFACSADGPKDIQVEDWFLRLEMILFNAAGQAIYVSEADDSTLPGTTIRSAGALCSFDGFETWTADDLIDHGYIEFPRALEPAAAVVYVSPEETSKVEILTDTYTAVHRPPTVDPAGP